MRAEFSANSSGRQLGGTDDTHNERGIVAGQPVHSAEAGSLLDGGFVWPPPRFSVNADSKELKTLCFAKLLQGLILSNLQALICTKSEAKRCFCKC